MTHAIEKRIHTISMLQKKHVVSTFLLHRQFQFA